MKVVDESTLPGLGADSRCRRITIEFNEREAVESDAVYNFIKDLRDAWEKLIHDHREEQ